MKGVFLYKAGARALIGGGGGVFIYSGSARLVFLNKVDFNFKRN